MDRAPLLWRYSTLSAAAVLINLSFYLAFVRAGGFVTALFVLAVAGTVTVLLTLPAHGFVLLWNRLISARRLDGLFARAPRAREAVVFGAAVAAFSLVQIFLYFDRFIYRLYGFHMNGFVWNLLTTRGGVDALGSGSATKATFALIVVLFVAVQAGLLVVLLKSRALREGRPALFSRKNLIVASAVFVAAILFDKGTYGLSRYKLYGPVLAAADAFPLYIPCSFAGLARSLGFEEAKDGSAFKVDTSARRLKWPLAPIRREPSAPKYNVVWLTAESWRWDMLTPEIMPRTWAFAEKSARFTRHYSGGNGTRMGVFTMFTGLYGSYWFPCLEARRGAPLMDLLMEEGYQIDLSTSAVFTYPEFDRTIFARVPKERLHEAAPADGWVADRANVTRLLDVIDRRDPSKPFMTFMFFESPHAPYNFPEECAIRKPYPAELNYLSMELKDVGPIKNRYMNACNHLDTQFARILTYLEEKGLLDSTIVLMTGDHGEEFMEKGRWGHSSEFHEEQVRVPLVLHAPGKKASRIDRLTSHLDLAPTVMTLLGVTNPPEDYSLGVDLFGPAAREFTIFSGWNHLMYGDGRAKADLPLRTWDVVHRKVTTMEDQPLPDRSAFYEENRVQLLKVLKDLGRFLE
jgi:uncharacterized protein